MGVKDIERRFRGGETIVERGTTGQELFVVREGNVLLQRRPGEATHLLTTGDIFGEVTAVLGRPYSFRAEAEGDVVVLRVDRTLLNQLLSESTEFAFRLVQHLAGRIEAAPPEPGQEPIVEVEPESDAAEASVLPDLPPAQLRAEMAAAAASFARALLDLATGDELPLPVKGRLSDIAQEADLEMLDAYVCLQSLLDQRVVRLVDDQLSVLLVDELRTLIGG